MHLENPKQQRSLAGIIAGLTETERTEAVKILLRANRYLDQQVKRDTALVYALSRILTSPLGDGLAQTIKDIANGQ
jgi:hypothetical protein